MAISADAAPCPTAEDFRVSIIGPNASMVGDLEFDGELRVEGRVDGHLRCRRLVVGPQGHLEGSVVGQEIKIFGRVDGEIRGGTIDVCDGANVSARIVYTGLTMGARATFEGTLKRLAGEQIDV